MDPAPLLTWLQLPTGPWPPDHYTLLGLHPSAHSSAAIESRVLERMDLLRRHQLLQPELVTEGMNRLAQALITLTDPQEKAAYDAEHGFAPIPEPQPVGTPPTPDGGLTRGTVVVADPLPDDDIFSDDVVAPTSNDSPDATQFIEVPSGAHIIDWKTSSGTVPPRVIAWEENPLPYEVLPETEVTTEPEVLELPPEEPSQVVEPATPISGGPESRRWIYTRLALLRRAMPAWYSLRHVLADPNDPVDRPGRVVVLLEAARAVRPLLPKLQGLIGGVNEPGGMVAAIVNQPLLLDTLRRLLPDQRQALAIDWRRGETELRAEISRLRRLAQSRKPEPKARSILLTVGRLLWTVPELVLVIIGMLAIVIAAIRSTGP